MQYYLKKQLIIAFIVYIGQVLVGYGLGWSAPIIPKLQDPNKSPLPNPITDQQASWIGSVIYIGAITGPYVTGYLSNVKGRKVCLFLSGILTTFAFLLLGLSRNLAMILTGRIFTGLGLGIIFVINLVYLGEIASTNVRGILLTGTGVFMTLGTVTVYSVGPYISYAATNFVGLGITIVYLIGLIFIPETPLFHVIKGNEEEAKAVLNILGREDDIDSLLITKLKTKEEKGQWKDLFQGSNRRALFITFTLSVLQQLSGVLVVVFYATVIFDLAGSSIEPNLATIIIGVAQLVASCIAPLFVDRCGRKILLLISTAISCLCLAVLGLYLYIDYMNLAIAQSLKWLPLVSLIIFFLSYDMGFGIIPGTLIGEMFHSKVRSTGSAVTITAAWVFGFGISTAFGYMIAGIGGHGTFWIFSGSCLLAFLFTLFCVPETKGKTFLEIQEMLSS